MINYAKRENRSAGRHNTHFCVGFYKIWREKIHIIIKRLCDANGINWLRARISYQRFLNLRELIKGYLEIKLLKRLSSEEFVDRD